MNYYRNKEIKEEVKKEFKLIKKTNHAIHSLREVECFLHDLDKAFKYIHLYKFLK